jgi:hypothetical protein
MSEGRIQVQFTRRHSWPRSYFSKSRGGSIKASNFVRRPIGARKSDRLFDGVYLPIGNGNGSRGKLTERSLRSNLFWGQSKLELRSMLRWKTVLWVREHRPSTRSRLPSFTSWSISVIMMVTRNIGNQLWDHIDGEPCRASQCIRWKCSPHFDIWLQQNLFCYRVTDCRTVFRSL